MKAAGLRPALLAALVLSAAAARAAAPAGYVDEFAGELAAYADKLAAAPTGDCRAAYAALDGRQPLTIGVFFGFIDTARPDYVADGDFKRALIGQLTRPCRGSLRACGFAPAPPETAAANKTRLTGLVGGRRVALDVFDSSLRADYGADVGTLAEEQRARSRAAEEQFLAALKKDAVVLYAGHTRRFSGTGFFPPVYSPAGAGSLLRPPYYLRVYDALRASAPRPAVLGLFACHTREYYAGAIHAAAPGTALIVTPDSSGHENNLLALFGALDAVLARRCAAAAERSVNPDGTRTFRVYGLFDAAAPRFVRFQDGRLVLLELLLLPLLVLLASKTFPGKGLEGEARPFGGWRGAAPLILSLAPCAFALRSVRDQAAVLPLLLALSGALCVSLAAAAGRLPLARLARVSREAWRPALAFVLLYLAVNLARDASLDNALSALRQAGTLSLLLALLWPFAVFSEEALLLPFAGEGGAGLVPACVLALLAYAAVWVALCALAPVYKPRLWPLVALALYGRALSFWLYRRRPQLAVAALAQALTLALIIGEGLHALIYN